MTQWQQQLSICVNLTVYELLQEEHWPLFLSVVVVPTFIQLMLLPWFPESPRYLLIEKHNVHATITGQCCGIAVHQQGEALQEEENTGFNIVH